MAQTETKAKPSGFVVDDRLPKLDAPPAEATKVASVEVTVSEDEEDGPDAGMRVSRMCVRCCSPLLSHGCVFSCLKSHVRVGAGTREDAVLVCCIALVLKWRELWARRDNARMRYATVKDARVHA